MNKSTCSIIKATRLVLLRSARRIPVIVAVVIPVFWMLVAGQARAELMIIDFEGFGAMPYSDIKSPIPPSARLSDAFLFTHGVRFSSGSPYVAVVDLGVGHATSGTNGIGGSTPTGVLTYDHNFPIVMSFFDPSDPSRPAVTDFISVRGDLRGERQSVTLNAFDVDGNLITSFTTTNVGGEALSISAPGIHSVQFLGTEDTHGVALDDLTFNSVTPAAPSAGPVVPNDVGGTVTGVNPRRVVCRNLTTMQTVIIEDGSRSWDCAAAGLVVHTGDRIQLTVRGLAD
jgi:hypothetical protein